MTKKSTSLEMAVTVTVLLSSGACHTIHDIGYNSETGGVTSTGASLASGGVAPAMGGTSATGGATQATGGSLGTGGTALATGRTSPTGGSPSLDCSTDPHCSTTAQVSCTRTGLLCEMAPPACPTLQVPEITSDGTCFTRNCIPIEQCACNAAADCPDNNQYTCNLSSRHCTPYL